MKKLRRFVIIIYAAVIALTFAACAGSAFDYDKDAVTKRAAEVIDVINTRDYDAIYNLFREDLKPLTSADDFKTAWEPYLSPAGAFVEIKSTDSTGQADQKSGEKYILAAVKCQYENKTYIYTIIMDTDLNVTGLYLK